MTAMISSPIARRAPCSVCGLDTFRHKGWFLVVDNRWLDRLRILSWHPSLATQKDMKSVCCRDHLKTLIAHWLTQASLRLPPSHFAPHDPLRDLGHYPPMPIGSDPSLSDLDLGPDAMGRVVGELAVHRESFSRVWSGSPEALECILEALITIGAENKPHALECQLFTLPQQSPHGISLQ
ncbi:MAG: hypothetical protein WCB56_18285 [Terriglobales bacterium]